MGTRSLQSPKITISASGSVRNVMTTDTTKVASASISHSYDKTLTNGVSASQANRAHEYTATLNSAATQVIDLYDFGSLDAGAGAGDDFVGQAIALEEIVAIIIENLNEVDAAGQLEVEPDSSNGWTPIGSHTASNGGALRGGGCLAKSQIAEQGFNVTDASNHRLLLTANGGSVEYKITVIARHDDNESSSSSSSSSLSSSSSSSSSVSSSSSSSVSSSSSGSSSSSSSSSSSVSSSSSSQSA